MEYLWAPWRMEYILGKKKKGCFLCKEVSEKKNKKNLILYQGESVFVVMNKFPYTNGHLMVVPKRHCLHLEQLDKGELKELFDLLKTCVRILKATFHPHGFNVGMNIGKVGGAGEDHLHLHIVPRWAGDTNFMPVLGNTKVISEYLGETYQKLHSAFLDQAPHKTVRKGG
ncbi:MAG TPA: HIT domain-containing protein [Thermodesulfobacteriota bacterium]|nr:HIT domain-containing protein [Thermodesulfobacteriota bacterium]